LENEDIFVFVNVDIS